LSFLEPFLFGVLEDGNLSGLICGYIIADGGAVKQYFSRRAIVPGGLLLDKDVSEVALQTLLQHTVKHLKKKAIYIEIRNYNDYTPFRTIIEKAGFVYNPHLNFHVKTESEEGCLKQLHSSKRRAVKLTKKAGVEIVEIADSKELKQYYSILENLYKYKVKTRLFPYEFFENFAHLPEGKIFGIKYQGNIIGGSVCACYGTVVYEWFVCGLDGKWKNVFPSVLATWAGIEFSAKNNFKYFDFMGAGKPSEPYGVRNFKAEFGGELVEHGRFVCVCNSLLYNLGKEAIRFLKK
jgi:lipid II:glycine glycyltransferase (peptidoglycan interpeptide bridge formation enzyme)